MEGGLLYMGFDLSTQQLKVAVVDADLKVVHESAVSFDKDLPHYGTKEGAIRHADGVTVTAPTLMWVEALDRLLANMKRDGFDFGKVAAVSGAAQQHGSVYWARGSADRLKKMDPERELLLQLRDGFATTDSPIWMDASTVKECDERTHLMGGSQKVADVTGSSAYCRFTANQIRKIAQRQPSVYENCERISLVSSALASILLGGYAPIDVSDGSGMNLLNIHTREWDQKSLDITAPGLREKLGPVGMPGSVLGTVSPYFCAKFGFAKSCRLVIFTGDNPGSLAGLRLKSGDIAVSLGTSDTVFLAMAPPIAPGPEGHVMCSPVDPIGYMGMLCYSNGSLTRSHVMERTAHTWDAFCKLLDSTPPGNNGHIGFYFETTEIIPANVHGTYRYDANNNLVESFDPAVEVRAVIESQMVAKRLHCAKLGLVSTGHGRIIATGGASSNHHILQVISNVFGLPVYTYPQPGSAGLGAAYIAYWAGENSFTSCTSSAPQPVLTVTPNMAAHTTYTAMLGRYSAMESALPPTN